MQSNNPARQKYRKDVDGLRAIAVLSVFLYHLQPELLPGGFLGVDVFFVISGYLITGIIVREHHQQCFSFSHFYARRIKRIFPALFVVLALSACVALLLMTPESYINFMKSGRYAAAQLSNFFFSQKVDYFSEGFSAQPLLHTWSLGVEEQFYLFWPLLIYTCFRCFQSQKTPALSQPGTDESSGNRPASSGTRQNITAAHRLDYRIGGVFFLLALISFWICYQLTTTSYNLAFYMFYTRAFEFCIGGGLALNILPALKSERANRVAGTAGLIMLGYSFLFIGEEYSGRSFLQFGVLVPCIGSGLIIHAHNRKSVANRLISTRFPVYVGKISYSLYLYHWPVIIFWKLFSNHRSLEGPESAVIILVSFLLATLSYFFIEQPARKGSWAHWKTIVSAAVIILFFASSFRILENFDESKWRITRYEQERFENSNHQAIGCRKTSKKGVKFYQCQDSNTEDTPVLALLGDSHAPHYLQSATSWAKKNGYNVKYSAVPGCPMVLGDVSIHQTVFEEKYTEVCQRTLSLLDQNIVEDPRVEIVMIAQRYDLFYDGKGYLNNIRMITFKDDNGRVVEDHTSYYKNRLSETVEIMKNAGKKVIILKQVPLNIGTDSCDWQPLLFNLLNQEKSCEFDYGFISKWQRPSIEFIDNFIHDHELPVFDPATVMDKPHMNGTNLYQDGDHLNLHGVYYLIPYVEQALDKLMADGSETKSE